jgi:DNA-binding transcriptional ArsR family regulator
MDGALTNEAASPDRPARPVAEQPRCAGAVLAHPAIEQIELAQVLHALSDPLRLAVVVQLADGSERTCSSFELPVVKSTCTHHFRVLREAGLIRQRMDGKAKLNALRREDLDARFPGLLDAVIGAVSSDSRQDG